ncbi:MAG: hypothetical protein PHQ47_00605, partial [Candidatus Portnoybacteria bacterium]|nr:hypothetical protein [Candidatus Portnoybacteria bacterium]
MFSSKQQAFEIIDKSQSILIVLPKDASLDNIACALAFFNFFRDTDKKAEIVCQELTLEKISFLPLSSEMKKEPAAPRQFIISVNAAENQIKQLRYEAQEKELKIFIFSHGKIEQKDLKLEPGPFNYDLIIIVGAPDLESLGHYYEKYPDLFFEKPILNIDNHPGNEHYGEINLVEPTASSCSEIAADLFNAFFSTQITP